MLSNAKLSDAAAQVIVQGALVAVCSQHGSKLKEIDLSSNRIGINESILGHSHSTGVSVNGSLASSVRSKTSEKSNLSASGTSCVASISDLLGNPSCTLESLYLGW